MLDLINVNYDTLIPNNVNLSTDKKVLKALERWHPGYIDWWNDLGPAGFQESLVYLRTAVSVDPKGWAKFDYVKMPEYRWGVLLAPAVEDRTIPCGEHMGEPAWQEVPGEYRAMLQRLIVIQGDTEPASVEQQRHLGKTAPSLYDMRNLFQVNVEEGRHLWAMVYLLQKYFGKQGREEADDLLRRTSGSEEAHHMFVGETGDGRVIQRTCEAMKEAGISDPTDINKIRDLGVIDLPTIQKKLNLHYSLSLDLFGQEMSTNAANAFNAGIKGRYMETKIDDDHILKDATYPVRQLENGEIVTVDAPALSAINMRLRDDYTRDASGGVKRWNKAIEKMGIDFELTLPHEGFHRHIGVFNGTQISPEGDVLTTDEWSKRRDEWLPNSADGDFIQSLMKPVWGPGEYAGWIAPPKIGIDNKPGDFEYVQLHMA